MCAGRMMMMTSYGVKNLNETSLGREGKEMRLKTENPTDLTELLCNKTSCFGKDIAILHSVTSVRCLK